ncbi:MAG: 5'-3' exonuclease H3TH domain-containing protein [Acidobacteriota bacterium]|nr:5'-3' exonuclease H3TH domain-containing protein [Acidobacteriota bacterium]
MKIHLVDGTYELFRAFYGPPPRQAPDGTEIGGARGLMMSLLSLLREDGVTHVACAFDTVIESFRNDLFAGYKTGEGVDPVLLAQFPLAERVAETLGVVVWRMREFEADDALATAAARFSQERGVEQVVLCSPDKDLAQCVDGQRVVCLDRRRETLLDEAGVEEKFGVPPASIPDLLALVGDSADGIPGLKGWGAKSAATALARYGHLDQIPEDPTDWDVKIRGAARLAETLAAQRDDALLYRRLATLRTDVPLEETLDDLHWRGALRPAVEDLAQAWGEPGLVERVHGWQ